jgi:transposase
MSESMPAGEPVFAAYIGIDWGDRKHAWSLEVAGTGQRARGTLEQTPEAIEVWACELAARFEGRLIAVGLEQSRGALLYALSKYSHLVLYPIHPGTSAQFRKALCPSGAKDDPRDADMLLELVTLHRGRLRALAPDDELTRKLQHLVEKRRQLVDEKTAQSNRIVGLLKLYFPQVLDWFDEIGAPLAAAFLERWPRLEQLQAEDPDEIRDFLHQHNCRSQQRNEKRIEQIQKARPAILDRAVIEPAALVVQVLARVVAVLHRGIADLEREIVKVTTVHPDYPIFASFPGAGPAMAPRLLAAMGSQRERFPSAKNVQALSGIAPVISQSGKARWVHFRWACPKFERQSFHEFAGLSIQQCSWARAFYDQQRAKGKGHHAAVRSLAFKWIRIIFRCWQTRTPYRDELYVRALETRRTGEPKKKRHPQLEAAAETTSTEAAREDTVNFQFENVAGFCKFSAVSY